MRSKGGWTFGRWRVGSLDTYYGHKFITIWGPEHGHSLAHVYFPGGDKLQGESNARLMVLSKDLLRVATEARDYLASGMAGSAEQASELLGRLDEVLGWVWDGPPADADTPDYAHDSQEDADKQDRTV